MLLVFVISGRDNCSNGCINDGGSGGNNNNISCRSNNDNDNINGNCGSFIKL